MIENSEKVTYIFRMVIAIAFIVLSGVVIWIKDKTTLPTSNAYIFAVILFLYGLFRIYRARKNYL
jgi:hypothetical protein